MSGFNTKDKNNNGEYEITFYTDNQEDFKEVEDLCRELLGHNKPNEVRLADVYALKIELSKQITYFDDKAIHQSNTQDALRYRYTCDGLKLAKNIVDNAPEIDPEVPKGIWIKSSNMSKRSYQRMCSNCMKISYFCGDGNYPNCPYCLATMQGNAGDEDAATNK